MLDKYRYGSSELFDGPVELFKCVCDHINGNIIRSIPDVDKYKDIIARINTDQDVNKLQLQFDEVVKTMPRHTCNKCRKKFNNQSNFKRHMKRKTSCYKKCIYNCNRCGKAFTHKTKYNNHVNRKFPCNRRNK